MTALDMNGDSNARAAQSRPFCGLASRSKVNSCPQNDCLKLSTSRFLSSLLSGAPLPRMDGVEAASEVRAMMPRLPIVLFTMYEDVVGWALALSAGADRVVSKPDGG
jgi:CheY-like chemotaxis protein